MKNLLYVWGLLGVTFLLIGCASQDTQPNVDAIQIKPKMLSKSSQGGTSTERLYLSIRPMSWIEDVPANILYKKLNEDLVIVLKEDSTPPDLQLPESFKTKEGEEIPIVGATKYVNEEELPNYKLSKDRLFEIALDNFDQEQMPLMVAPDPKDSSKAFYIFPQWETSFKYPEDSVQSHLLSQASLDILKEHLGDEFYIRLPNYETFSAFRKSVTKEDWDKIKQINMEFYENQPHPLLDKLYMYSKGKMITIKDEYSSK